MTSKRTLVYWLCFTLILSSTNEIFGQNRALNKILEGDYRGAEKIVMKKIEKDNDDLSYLFAYVKLLNTKEYKLYDSKNAYLEVKRLGSLFETSDEKEVKKAIHNGISLREIYDLKTKICYNAKVDAINSKDENTLNEFLTFFSEAPDVYKEEVIVARNQAAFINAQNRHTINAYQSFIDQYPGASQIGQAKELRNQLAYEEVVSIDQIASYEAFIRAYPTARQVSLAKSRIQTLAFEDAKQENTSGAFAGYLEKYPTSRHKTEATSLYEGCLFRETTIQGNWSSYKEYINTYGNNDWFDEAIDSLLAVFQSNPNRLIIEYILSLDYLDEVQYKNSVTEYYNYIKEDGEKATLDAFISRFGTPSYLTELSKDTSLARLAQDLKLSSQQAISLSNTTSENEELNRRLIREGGKSGSLQFSLMWNNYNDIDLHCIDPNGEQIYYGNKYVSSQGELDVDMNVESYESLEPVENIYWPENEAPVGVYRVFVHHYQNHQCGYNCQDPTPVFVSLKINGRVENFRVELHADEYATIKEFYYGGPETPIDDIVYNQNELQEFLDVSAPNDMGFLALQKLISKNVDLNQWDKVEAMINEYSQTYQMHPWFTDLQSLVRQPVDQSIKPIPLSRVNSEDGDEYAPVLTADGKRLLFCGKNTSFNLSEDDEDVFIAEHQNNKWQRPNLSNNLSDVNSNDAPMAISTDGNELIQFYEGKLGYRNKTSYGWTSLNLLPEQINRGEWNGDAMMSSDGNTLIFASVRNENQDYVDRNLDFYHGGAFYPSDIYMSTRENGVWSEPVNIGTQINTRYSERSPFLHPDMKTLYFSSAGHGGFGGYDVFVSKRLADSCWDCWSNPVNLGKEINSIRDDWGYRISTDGEYAVYSAIGNSGSYDLYSVNLPIHLRPGYVATVSGRLVDSDEQPIEASMRWEDLETGEVIGQSKSDPEDGSYFIVLPLGKLYGYFVDKEDYFPIANNVDLRDSVKPIEYEEDIKVVTFEEMKEDSIAVEINNLFFAFGQSSLLNYSKPELVRLSRIIQQFDLSIQINGHTDNIGETDNNMRLSEARAQSVKSFLIDLGCKAESMTIIGHGEKHPIASNETESGRAKNRRVEIVIVD